MVFRLRHSVHVRPRRVQVAVSRSTGVHFWLRCVSESNVSGSLRSRSRRDRQAPARLQSVRLNGGKRIKRAQLELLDGDGYSHGGNAVARNALSLTMSILARTSPYSPLAGLVLTIETDSEVRGHGRPSRNTRFLFQSATRWSTILTSRPPNAQAPRSQNMIVKTRRLQQRITLGFHQPKMKKYQLGHSTAWARL
jgi:hypothetical protein